jgi:hypothetical protein
MKRSDDIYERRIHPRVYVDLPLEYRVSNAPHRHGALVVNVSESGLLAHSIKDIPLGTKLNIAVLFPKEFEFSNFKVVAEIVWKDIHWENVEGIKLAENKPPVNDTLATVRMKTTMFGQILVGFGFDSSLIR